MKHTIGLMYLLDPFNRTSTQHTHKNPRTIDQLAGRPEPHRVSGVDHHPDFLARAAAKLMRQKRP